MFYYLMSYLTTTHKYDQRLGKTRWDNMKLEDIEAELKRKLEEIERRKRRLRELEEEEQKLLDELSEIGRFSRGSIVAKYVKCGNERCKSCPHGPYYYLVYKEGGKTRWKYIGKVINGMEAEKRKKARIIIQRLRQIQKEKKKLEQIDL